MAWWGWVLAVWVVLALVSALVLAHGIGLADRRERALRARAAAEHPPRPDRFAA